MVGDVKGGLALRGGGAVNQSHLGFFRGLTRFTAIAGYAGTNYVFPYMLTASVSWDYMVEGKLAGCPAAVLAGIAVAVEDLKAG